MGRPKKKIAYWEAKKAEAGKLQAQKEAEAKKPLTEKLKPYLEIILKRIDLLEAVAILGTTIIVHDVIFKMTEFSTKLSAMALSYPELLWSSIMFIIKGADVEAGKEFLKEVGPKTEKIAYAKVGADVEIMLWLAAFGIAYFAIKHGDDLLGVAKGFFGIGATAA